MFISQDFIYCILSFHLRCFVVQTKIKGKTCSAIVIGINEEGKGFTWIRQFEDCSYRDEQDEQNPEFVQEVRYVPLPRTLFFHNNKYLNEEGQINDHILCISKHHLTKITSNTVAVEVNVHFKIGIRSSALRAFRREERDVHCSKQKYLSFLIKQE